MSEQDAALGDGRQGTGIGAADPFLVARGVVDRHPVQLAISAGVAVVYGAMIWGVLPGQEGISWEAHLFGAVAGVIAAFLVRGEKRP